jgi:hypothetical protein
LSVAGHALRVLAFAALLAVSCGPTEVDVSGSVFIVTKGGDNVKLGLIKVTAIPETDAVAFIDAKLEEGEQEQEKLLPLLQQADAEYAEAKATWDRAKEESRVAFDKAMANLRASGLQASWHAASDRGMQALETSFDKSFELDAVRLRYSRWTSGSYYLDGIPDGVASAKTDADGKFTLRLLGGKRYVLAASANRQIADNTEYYHWLVWVTPTSDGGPVMLSNDNLVTSGSALSAVAATR